MVDPYTNGSLFAAILGILISMAAGLMWKNKWALFVSGIISYAIFRAVIAYLGEGPVDPTRAVLYGIGVLIVDLVGYVAYKKLTAPRSLGGTGFWTPDRKVYALFIIAILILLGVGYYVTWKIPAILILSVIAYLGYNYFGDWKKYIPVTVAGILILVILFGPAIWAGIKGEGKDFPAEEKMPAQEKKPTVEVTPKKLKTTPEKKTVITLYDNGSTTVESNQDAIAYAKDSTFVAAGTKTARISVTKALNGSLAGNAYATGNETVAAETN